MAIITVKITPKASRNEVLGWETQGEQRILRVKVTTAPEKGKANKALTELLAAYFKCSKSDISILRGATSQIKTIEIQEITGDTPL